MKRTKTKHAPSSQKKIRERQKNSVQNGPAKQLRLEGMTPKPIAELQDVCERLATAKAEEVIARQSAKEIEEEALETLDRLGLDHYFDGRFLLTVKKGDKKIKLEELSHDATKPEIAASEPVEKKENAPQA